MSVVDEVIIKAEAIEPTVGNCSAGCGRPARLMVSAATRNGGRIASTFTCASHVTNGQVWALRRQAEMIGEVVSR